MTGGACSRAPRAVVTWPLPEPQPLGGGPEGSGDQVPGRLGGLCSIPPLRSFPLESQLLTIFRQSAGFHHLEGSKVQLLPHLLGAFLSHSVEGNYLWVSRRPLLSPL